MPRLRTTAESLLAGVVFGVFADGVEDFAQGAGGGLGFGGEEFGAVGEGAGVGGVFGGGGGEGGVFVAGGLSGGAAEPRSSAPRYAWAFFIFPADSPLSQETEWTPSSC